jgi:hypothetical protein
MFRKEITLGNLLTIAGYIVAAAVFVANTNAQFSIVNATLALHAKAINNVSHAVYQHAVRPSDAPAGPPVFLLPTPDR